MDRERVWVTRSATRVNSEVRGGVMIGLYVQALGIYELHLGCAVEALRIY